MTKSLVSQHEFSRPNLAVALLATGLLGFGSIGCGETAGSAAGGTDGGTDGGTAGGTAGGTDGVAALGEACEAWCTDEGCRDIFIVFDSIDECRSSCVDDNASAACAAPYATYISCQANSQCVAFCQNEFFAWGACEDGGGGDLGDEESLTAVCKRGCATEGCENVFLGGSATQCLINCSRIPGGCDDTYKGFMQCQVDLACAGACRVEALALVECIR